MVWGGGGGSWKYQALAEDGLEEVAEGERDEAEIEAAAAAIAQEARHKSEPRVFRARSALPQELSFVVPDDHEPGGLVCVSGPHGPLLMPVPRGVGPGERAVVRLGPKDSHTLTVPDGFRSGDVIDFEGPAGERLQVTVPPGRLPGDTFEVTPPTLMVQVPLGAAPGDKVVFAAPDGCDLTATVPGGTAEGSYFAALLE
mmetsp:Transcript_42746/g.118016  ORF Transcript_42746/g.118016 Transcript_42746/m.118016 type:complete len:199 (+) Transcript_42746:120-716(+)